MSSFGHGRQRQQQMEDPSGMWIPGLGENKNRPRELGSTFFGYVPDAFSNVLPALPSETSSQSTRGETPSSSATTRSNSPRLDSQVGGKRRPRTAGDSSQMRDALWQPMSPTDERRMPVEEETVVAVEGRRNLEATPFYDNAKIVLIRGGNVVNDDCVLEGFDVLVEDGIIKEVAKEIDPPQEARVIDAQGKFVVPGGIDSSTALHNRKGDVAAAADDFASGTRAALSGGTTMVVDLVIPGAEESLLDAFKEWKADAEENSCCDFAFRVVAPRWNENVRDELGELVKKEGVNSVKVYLSHKDTLMLNNDELLEAFAACKDLGAVVEVAAENGDVVAENEKRLLARGVTGPEGHLLARPQEAEEEAVTRACAFAAQVNVPLVVAGPTGPAAVAAIARARQRGQVVSGRVTAAALALDGSHYFNPCWSHAASFVASPPLRDDPAVPAALVASLMEEDGGLQMVASENRSYNMSTREAVAKGRVFTIIPEGLNGIEDRMSVVWEKGVADGGMTPERFVAVTSSNAAKALNIYPRKGRLAVGSDADIVVWNTNNIRELSCKTHVQAADFNVFEGVKVSGAPEFVLSKGRLVVCEYQLNATTGCGHYVTLDAYPPALYGKLDAFARGERKVAVQREAKEQEDKHEQQLSPQKSVEEEPMVMMLNKKLGVYQRPMSAHGVRNQQDSTFSLAGGYEAAERRASVKVNAPPGGEGRAFW